MNITGTPDNDALYGSTHDDTIDGLAGDDFLLGGSGNDTEYGGDGQDDIHGSNGADHLMGGAGDDKLFGNAGNDILWGDDGHDVLKADDGDDVLMGGASRDSLYGGIGADTFMYTALTDSTDSAVDVIWDFEPGVDKIDVSALGFTGLAATGTAPEHQLRIVFSAATNRTYVRDDHSDFQIALNGDFRGVLTAADFRFDGPGAARVGYYEAEAGSGVDSSGYARPITQAGYTAVSLDDLTTASITGLKAVFVLNASNTDYGAEWLADRPDLANYVSSGGVLIIHDRYVTEAANILPGLSGETFVRSYSPSIDFVHDGDAIANGPGGTLTDASLDGGSWSNHGYALADSLSSDVHPVLSTDDPTHIVGFAYAYGAGAIYYSAMPLDYYLSGSGNATLDQAMQAYAANIIAWAVGDNHNLLDL